MTRSKLSSNVLLLVGGIGLSIAALVGSQPAAAQTYPDTCPAGTVYDPTYGCTLSGEYDFAYDGYPYGGYGLYGHHRDFGHGFAHGMGAEGTIIHHGMGFRSIRVAHVGSDGFADRCVNVAHLGRGGFGGFHGGGGFGGGGHR